MNIIGCLPFRTFRTFLTITKFFQLVCDTLSCSSVCVCVLSLFILDVKFVGCTSRGHRRKITRDFSSTFLLRCMPLFFLREGFSRLFSSSTVKSNFVYQRFNRSPFVGHFFFFFFASEEKSRLPGSELTSQRVRRLRGYQLSYRGDRSLILILYYYLYGRW